jgi:hypothetical protein
MDRPIIKRTRKPKSKKELNLRKKASPLKFKKSVVDKKAARKVLAKKQKDLRLPYETCISMPIREIRQTKEYKLLTPLGTKNTSGHYKHGNKSYLNKEKLCRALDDPSAYQNKISSLKDRKVNAGPRKRVTRTGDCPAKRELANCAVHPTHKNAGLTTAGKHCCYKKKQSRKVANKRRS